MSAALHKLPWLARKIALSATAFLIAGTNAHQDVLQSPPSSVAKKDPEYFPPGALDGYTNFFTEYLRLVAEPSLLTAAQDSNAHSYRFVWFSSQHGYQPAVRLSVNHDGSANIITAVESGTPPALRRTQQSISNADVNKFLQFVEEADFWSTPTTVKEKSVAGARAYKQDAGSWVFEAVRNGKYHVVIREGPAPGPFTEMVRFLTKNLAKLDNSAIPHASRKAGGSPLTR